MFEKEITNLCCSTCKAVICREKCECWNFAKKGAEFGYNKANEWHYVKDGDLPKDEDYKLCITSNGNYYIARYEELFVHWSNQEYKEVCCPYAWKEIELPKGIIEQND